MIRKTFQLQSPADRFGLNFAIADQPWKPILTHEAPGESARCETEKLGEFHMLPVREQEGDSIVDVEFTAIPASVRLLAIDEQGVEHVHSNADFNFNGDDCVANFTFPIPPTKVARLRLDVRPYSRTIEITGIALTRGVASQPVVKITELEK
jgi:hypothetical protein